MYRRNLILLVVIAVIFILAILALAYPVLGRDNMRLGLDLKGGVYLEYQVQFPTGTSAADQSTLIKKAVGVITTRIDKYGVAAPIVQAVGNSRISVQLPGFTDIDQAKSLVEQTGFLEFREIELDSGGNAVTLNTYLSQTTLAFIDQAETDKRYFVGNLADGKITAILQDNTDGTMGFTDINGKPLDIDTLKKGDTSAYSWIAARGSDKTQLTGQYLSSATASIQQGTSGNSPVVSITWDSKGTNYFNEIAARLSARPKDSIQRALGIFLDQELISYPQILYANYANGQAYIEGNFTVQETKTMANLLTSGALPLSLQKPPLYQNTVSASLGANFVKISVEAGIIGLLLIMIFMIVYYRIPGVMASLALLFYSAVVLAIFKLVPVTLNLAAIGGFVLSLGMAVDANILNFERMKEEIRLGRTLGSSIDSGFKRAWLAIRDSHVTNLIACVILFWIGNSVVSGEEVKGFALTLAIGVLMSLFTSLVVTRALLNLFIGSKVGERTSLFSTISSGRK